MNKFKYYFILLLAGISLVSCSKKDDDVETVPLRDYAVQYKADNDSIVKYLKTNYITVVNSPGTSQDQDVVIKKIVAGDGNVSIWDQKTYTLATRSVYSNDVTYNVYYLVLREGTSSAPTNTDRVVWSYSTTLLDNTVGDTSYGYPLTKNLYTYDPDAANEGTSEILPQFKTGTSTTDAGSGVISYQNFGAGVMFLPSGLAYYASGLGTIPAYAPVVCTFKLLDLQRMDHDLEIISGQTVNVPDGIPDYLEDINGDGYLYDYGANKTKYPNPPANLIDDTDGDGIPDFLDYDDDGDGYKTRFEITKPSNEVGPPNYGTSLFYPWNPTVDNPATPNVNEWEPRGIPRRPTGALTDPTKPESIDNPRKFIEDDFNAVGRLRIHLDKTYPYQKK